MYPYRRREKKARLLRTPFFIITALLILAVTAAILNFSVREIKVQGLNAADTQKVKSLVEEAIGRRYAGLISKRSLFFLPRSWISEEIERVIPAVKSAYVKVNRRTLHVLIKEREAEALFCPTGTISGAAATQEGTNSETHCYFVDGEGLVFGVAAEDQQKSYFRYEGKVDSESPIGSVVFGREFEAIKGLRSEFLSLGIETHALRERGRGEYEFIARYSLEPEPTSIIIFSAGAAKSAAAKLRRALLDSALQKLIGPERDFSKIAYIDLRFHNRVFYRPR